MANSELFLFGDARLLSGGARTTNNTTYDRPPPHVTGEPVTTKSIVLTHPNLSTMEHIFDAVASTGQQVHLGRDSYHAHSWHSDTCGTRLNVFLPAGKTALPTLGVEIETYLRDGVDRSTMLTDLRSNWFHFEEDGSLDRALGHELITEVLPPRVYRDLRLWTGLQNVASAYLDSWNRDTTGLHVHVGVDQFAQCWDLPVTTRNDRVAMGKLMVAFIYYGLLDPSFIAKIMLRKDTHYCHAGVPHALARAIEGVGKDKFTASDMTSSIASHFYSPNYAGAMLTELSSNMANVYSSHYHPSEYEGVDGSSYTLEASTLKHDVARAISTSTVSGHWFNGTPCEFSSHSSEINMDHPYTIEFRRGKGTLNAVSVHRMVEFASLIVRYAWKIARTPDMEVNSASVYRYIIENTTSAALAKVAKEYLGMVQGRKERVKCA